MMGTNFGFNLLAATQSVIGKQDYQIVKWLSKTENEIGNDVDVYAEPEDRAGSVQPVARNKYQNLGLDFSKIYIQVWDVELIDVLSRSENADQIIFNGGKYKALPDLDWSNSGGWNSVLCVRIGNA